MIKPIKACCEDCEHEITLSDNAIDCHPENLCMIYPKCKPEKYKPMTSKEIREAREVLLSYNN